MAFARAGLTRFLVACAAFALCLPLLAAAALVSIGPYGDIPFLSALALSCGFAAAVAARRQRLLAASLALSLFLVLASPHVGSQQVDNERELSRLAVGWPFAFVEVDSSLTPDVFPETVEWSPWDDPARLRLGPFLLDWLLVAGATVAVAFAGRSAIRALDRPE